MTTDAQELDLRPGYVAMKWYRSRTIPFTVTAVDSAGTAINLTGASASMQIKNASGTVLMTLSTTTGQGIVLTNAASGIMTISPEAVGTSVLPLDNVLSMDLKVTLATGVVYVFFRGHITLIDKITA
jgi:hypothetical protein